MLCSELGRWNLLNKAESRSQKRILVVLLMLQIIVLRFAVNRFLATIEGMFIIGNNYSFSAKVFESCMLILSGQSKSTQ